ncbi:MAG: PQQ-binding-like beta-propeller repeat protein, partial [Planctomycetota bacterium]
LMTGDRTGDPGMTNVFSAMLVLVAVFIALLWFAFAAPLRRRTRLLTLVGLLLGVIAFGQLVRFEGFSGDMVPIFTSRFATPRPEPTTIATGRLVDLTVTSLDDFAGFLGTNRDQFVAHVELDPDWTTHPPHPLWLQPIGPGWSAFAIVNGVAVTQEERSGHQAVTAYDLETGEFIWAHEWASAFDHPAGGPGPRATPTLHGGNVYACGPFGRLVCLDGSTGSVIWDVDLPALLGVDRAEERGRLPYGRSGSPLIHGDLVITQGGGASNLVAFDKRTGVEAWRGSPHGLSQSSPTVGTVAGVEQILIVNEQTVSGHDPATGAELWSHEWESGRSNADATSSQPVVIGPNSVMVSKGYGVGAVRVDLAITDDGSLAPTERWRQRRSLRTKFTNAYIRDGHAYALSGGILECIELEGGMRAWKGGRYGNGQILGIGSLLLVLTEEGEMVLVDPTPEHGDHELARAEGIEGRTWNNAAFAGDIVVIRNGHEAAAYRLRLAGDAEPAQPAPAGIAPPAE